MENLYLKNIFASSHEPLVSTADVMAIGDAEIAADGTVTTKALGGVKTKMFEANEEVVILLTIKSKKHLTIRVSSVDSKGEVCTDAMPPYTSLGADNETETVYRSFDAANLAVYHDAVKFFIQIECEGENSFKIIDGMIRAKSPLERLSIYADDLEGMIKNIDKRLSMIEFAAASNTENIIASPSGKKFIVNVDDDGNISSAPVIPNKVLFMGNSLLLGMGHYGMCATDPKHDYFHFVSEAIKEKNPSAEISRVHGAVFEQLEDPKLFDELWSKKPNCHTGKPTCTSFTPDLDLIVIQLVENVNSQIRMDTFEAIIDKFILNIKERSPKARIVWVHGWWSIPRRDTIVEEACRRHRIGCISIGDIYGGDTIGKLGQTYELADGTVKKCPGLWLGHPGDEGMKQIAERIIDFLKM